MKTIIIALASLMIFASKGSLISAQNTLITFDTIRIVEADYFRFDFTIQDTLIDTINIHTYQATQLSEVRFKFGSGIIGNLVTSATGFNLFPGSKETDFYFASRMQTNNPNLDWRFDIYTAGYVQKNRERVQNSDGSYSVETTYSNVYAWDKGPIGYIIEDQDTIGWSYLYMQPRMDSIQAEWLKMVYKGKPQPKLHKPEFVMKGEFTGNEIKIVDNTDEDRIYIIKQDTIMGIYQIQKPPKMALKKKNRKVYQPYLLVNNNLTEWERMDVLRLAMVGVRMWRLVNWQF